MSKFLLRWMVVLAVAFGGLGFLSPKAMAAPDEVALVEQLKTQAFDALKAGKFDQTSELLTKAATLSKDPSVHQMASWISQFESQLQEFSAERHKQYNKSVAEIKKLLAHHKDSYAIDVTARAYLLADDKKAFLAKPWVDHLIKEAAAMAEQSEQHEQWLKSLRLYASLSSMAPSTPKWKDKLKLITRRVRLLGMYAPDVLEAMQRKETKQRDAVDAILNPTTRPATQPDKAADDNHSFRIDWRERVHGADKSMLIDSLIDARTNYYRNVDYKTLLDGGLQGLKVLLTTKGLGETFPGLRDADKRQAMIRTIDQSLGSIDDKASETTVRDTLDKVMVANQTTVQLPDQVVVTEFADGAFGKLDPFSTMIWPSEVEEFNKTTQGEFSGVGIQIQLAKDGSLMVVTPLEDSPAYKAGIQAGDIITRIDGKNAKGITIDQAVRTITGPVGTTVTLTVRSPDGTVKDYPIERQTIKVASVKGWQHLPGGGWDYFVDPANKIGYIRLTSFTKSSPEEMSHALDELKSQGAKALIMDLRYNPGGLLSSATAISNDFIDSGRIVSTRANRDTPNQPTQVDAEPGPDKCELPMAVLVNQYSASAAEILSGALKDHHRAKIIGERTFGKGSVQMLFPLDNRQAFLKLTTSHYYLPSGRCIHREENSTDWGVDPDLTIDMTPEQMNAATHALRALDVLHDAPSANAHAATQPAATTRPLKRDALASDPQLSAAVLFLRMQLAGAQL